MVIMGKINIDSATQLYAVDQRTVKVRVNGRFTASRFTLFG